MLRSQLFIAAALLSGVAIGYFAKPDSGEAGPAPAPSLLRENMVKYRRWLFKGLRKWRLKL